MFFTVGADKKGDGHIGSLEALIIPEKHCFGKFQQRNEI
jgi:hypothetical protein